MVHGLADELVDVIPDEEVCITYDPVKKFRVHRALCDCVKLFLLYLCNPRGLSLRITMQIYRIFYNK